jgi:hypothetical protein
MLERAGYYWSHWLSSDSAALRRIRKRGKLVYFFQSTQQRQFYDAEVSLRVGR